MSLLQALFAASTVIKFYQASMFACVQFYNFTIFVYDIHCKLHVAASIIAQSCIHFALEDRISAK